MALAGRAKGARWQLVWTEEAIRDFYLNNVLIHELGHILDSRNTSHRDRERYAEWFALEMGYKASRRQSWPSGRWASTWSSATAARKLLLSTFAAKIRLD